VCAAVRQRHANTATIATTSTSMDHATWRTRILEAIHVIFP
jgi:hypothetical protein